MLDVGIPYKKIKVGYVDYAIITHEHGDHAHIPTIKKLLANGTDIYMTKGTRDKLKLENRHNLHTFTAGLTMQPLRIADCWFKAIPAKHDAAEPIVFQLYDDEDRVLYSTDTREPQDWSGEDNDFTKILIETNFSEAALLESEIDDWRKQRVFESHSSIERVEKWFAEHKFSKLKEVHLMHISKVNGNAEEFKARLESFKTVNGIPVYTH